MTGAPMIMGLPQKSAVELRARLAAKVEIDIAASGGPVAGADELPVG